MGHDGRIRIPLEEDAYNILLLWKKYRNHRSYSDALREMYKMAIYFLQIEECMDRRDVPCLEKMIRAK